MSDIDTVQEAVAESTAQVEARRTRELDSRAAEADRLMMTTSATDQTAHILALYKIGVHSAQRRPEELVMPDYLDLQDWANVSDHPDLRNLYLGSGKLPRSSDKQRAALTKQIGRYYRAGGGVLEVWWPDLSDSEDIEAAREARSHALQTALEEVESMSKSQRFFASWKLRLSLDPFHKIFSVALKPAQYEAN